MRTEFTPEQLRDPDIGEANRILRACVHCGFCTATCPTYLLLGDELDSPRGRIYLIKQMLESGAPATAGTVKHIDRCLSCLSCMTTCPSGVHYMHLVDQARAHIEKTYRRGPMDRGLRWLLALLLPRPGLFRLALIGAWLARPLRGALSGRLRAMFDLAPAVLSSPSPVDRPQTLPAEGRRRGRVALLSGCAQPALNPAINEATVRLLCRQGFEVVIARGSGCCGSLVHHMGKTDTAHRQAAANIDAWWRQTREGGGDGLDAIIITTSGCGTTVKDYGFMFRNDAEWAARAAAVSALTRDITEFLTERDLQIDQPLPAQRVAYHSACSMQHGQDIREQPGTLLTKAGFDVADVPEGHICCGSAGVYNILQPDIARRLQQRKVAHIAGLAPDLIATGNIGCMVQIGAATDLPVVHTVELLDWATGGPKPGALTP